MHNKLKNIIQEKDFIKKIITFDKVKMVDYENKYLDFSSIIKNTLNDNDKIENLSLKRNSKEMINSGLSDIHLCIDGFSNKSHEKCLIHSNLIIMISFRIDLSFLF